MCFGVPLLQGPQTHRAQRAGELSQEIMFIQLCARLILVKKGKLELLHFLKVVVNNEFLGKSWVEVVHCCLCPVQLQRKRGIYANASYSFVTETEFSQSHPETSQ